jgi:DNA-binding Lrp family transcriptional regulator
MELTLRDEHVLSAIALKGDSSIEEVSRAISLPAHLIRNSIERLRRKSLVVPRLHLDLYRLGLTEFSIYFSLSGDSALRTSALDYLFSRPEISWAVEILGEFQYACSGYFSSINEFHSFIQHVHDRYPGVIKSGPIMTTLSLIDYGFAGGSKKSSRSFRYGFSSNSTVKLDELDHRIIRALSDDPCQRLSVIARSLHMPLSTLTHRVQRLRDYGVIQGTQLLFNSPASKFGSYRVLVSCPGVTTNERARVEELCMKHPLIYFLVEVAGEWNFEVGVFAKSAWDVNKITEQICDIFRGHTAKTRVLADARLVKLNPFPLNPPSH